MMDVVSQKRRFSWMRFIRFAGFSILALISGVLWQALVMPVGLHVPSLSVVEPSLRAGETPLALDRLSAEPELLIRHAGTSGETLELALPVVDGRRLTVQDLTRQEGNWTVTFDGQRLETKQTGATIAFPLSYDISSIDFLGRPEGPVVEVEYGEARKKVSLVRAEYGWAPEAVPVPLARHAAKLGGLLTAQTYTLTPATVVTDMTVHIGYRWRIAPTLSPAGSEAITIEIPLSARWDAFRQSLSESLVALIIVSGLGLLAALAGSNIDLSAVTNTPRTAAGVQWLVALAAAVFLLQGVRLPVPLHWTLALVVGLIGLSCLRALHLIARGWRGGGRRTLLPSGILPASLAAWVTISRAAWQDLGTIPQWVNLSSFTAEYPHLAALTMAGLMSASLIIAVHAFTISWIGNPRVASLVSWIMVVWAPFILTAEQTESGVFLVLALGFASLAAGWLWSAHRTDPERALAPATAFGISTGALLTLAPVTLVSGLVAIVLVVRSLRSGLRRAAVIGALPVLIGLCVGMAGQLSVTPTTAPHPASISEAVRTNLEYPIETILLGLPSGENLGAVPKGPSPSGSFQKASSAKLFLWLLLVCAALNIWHARRLLFADLGKVLFGGTLVSALIILVAGRCSLLAAADGFVLATLPWISVWLIVPLAIAAVHNRLDPGLFVHAAWLRPVSLTLLVILAGLNVTMLWYETIRVHPAIP